MLNFDKYKVTIHLISKSLSKILSLNHSHCCRMHNMDNGHDFILRLKAKETLIIIFYVIILGIDILKIM